MGSFSRPTTAGTSGPRRVGHHGDHRGSSSTCRWAGGPFRNGLDARLWWDWGLFVAIGGGDIGAGVGHYSLTNSPTKPGAGGHRVGLAVQLRAAPSGAAIPGLSRVRQHPRDFWTWVGGGRDRLFRPLFWGHAERTAFIGRLATSI